MGSRIGRTIRASTITFCLEKEIFKTERDSDYFYYFCSVRGNGRFEYNSSRDIIIQFPKFEYALGLCLILWILSIHLWG